MTAPSPPLRSYEAELESMLARIEALEVASRSPQLGGSSIDNGALQVRGADGTILQTWGVQPDGTAGTRSLNKVPPPPPGAADVTAIMAGLDVAWSGQLTGNMPADFRCVNVHVSIVPDFIVGPSNLVGSIIEAGSYTVAPLPYATHYVKLVAVNLAGAQSEASLQSSGDPQQVVADAVLDGIIAEVALAEGAVTAAKLAAAAVTLTKIADGSISTPKLIAGAVQAEKIAADAVSAGKIAANAVTAREVKAQSLTGDEIAANSITAGHVRAGAITADKLSAVLAITNRLVAGNPIGTRVELSGSGLLVVRDDGEKTFEIDASTGDVTSYGTYYTSRYGERLAFNAQGASPMMRAYPTRGSYYASLGALTATAVNRADQVAFWSFKVPYLSQTSVVGFVEFCAQNASSRTDIVSSKLWYRPYVNASGLAIPGWQAFHQDVALTFSAGRVYVRNNDNTASRDFEALRGSFNNVEILGNSIFSRPYNGAVRWTADGAFEVVNRAGTAFEHLGAQDGVFRGAVFSAGVRLTSDARTKRGFGPVCDDVVDQVLDASVQEWEFLPEHSPDATPLRQWGPTAQDVPEPIRTTGADGWLGIDTHGYAAALHRVAQRQRDEIATLRDELAEQRSLTDQLTTRLNALDGAA